MHVVDTTVFYSPTSGGVKRYLAAKHAWLEQHPGWRHSLLVPGERTELHPNAVSTVRGYRLPGTFNYRLAWAPRVWAKLLDALAPDVIEAGDAFHPAWAALRVARRRNIPLAAFFHSNLPQIIGRRLGSMSERVITRYVRGLYSRFDLVFAPSQYMCGYLESIGVRSAVHQPLGVDTEIFAPTRAGIPIRTKLGLRPQTRVLAFAGRFSAEKNLPVLRRALQLLGPRYHLLLIGGAKARRDGNITVLPYRRDPRELAAWLASADALVHAGTRETFGLVILEAMACGRPVIAANAGAAPELVDERVGALARPCDAQDLARAIVCVYERGVDALGMAARARVLESFCWSRCFELQQSHYLSLAGLHHAHAAPARRGTQPLISS